MERPSKIKKKIFVMFSLTCNKTFLEWKSFCLFKSKNISLRL